MGNNFSNHNWCVGMCLQCNYIFFMKPFKFAPTDEMQKAMSWCFKNGIKQYVVPRKNEFWIVLDHNGKKRKSPTAYKKIDEAHQKIWEIYLYFYKKHKG